LSTPVHSAINEAQDSGTPTVVVTPSEVSPGRASLPRSVAEAKLSIVDSTTVGVETTVVIRTTEGESPGHYSPTVVDSPALVWSDPSGNLYEARRVLKVTNARHSMTLGEERIYQAIWQATEADGVITDGESKLFTLGYDRLAKLVRLNEKSVRMSLPKMIAKQIFQLIASEDSASRTGRTYRIFSVEEILRRQKAANLDFIVKNGRAVEFVRPAKGGEWMESPTVGDTS